MRIGIIDYGAGNLLSVKKAFDFLGVNAFFVKSDGEMESARAIVLPGVGAFGSAMESLKDLKSSIVEWINDGKPYLGICLGLQLLFEESEESPGVKGLSVLQGKVARFQADKVPQIGWNSIHIIKNTPVFEGIQDGEYFYFLHSYYVVPENDEIIISKTVYGGETYTSGVQKGNLVAVQFHPEKSGQAGLKFLKNWLNFLRKISKP